ncbi:MAG: alpha/beta hydrolase [Ignavibacteriaceae bacterium]|jgi:acetyl esterase/lipase|nr:alpha/beta hydrolase [Ignavibacteriaceae bacterium]
MHKIKFALLIINLFIGNTAVFTQQITYETITNIPYYTNSTNQIDNYKNERCKLDLYYPTNMKNFPVVVWFHGGGLTGGEKEIPEALKEKGFAVVGVNYRISPKVKAPEYIEDAAAAVAWVFRNINNYGGDTSIIFVSGYSAGGYLVKMLGLDRKWLAVHGVEADKIAALISLSGHAITHFTIREERGIPGTQPIIDEFAPLYHVRKDAPPLILITGDRELELLGRYEENAYLMRMMKLNGHQKTKLYELDGYDHGILEAAFPLMVKEIKKIINKE